MMDDLTMQFLHWRVLLRLGAMPSFALFLLSAAYLNESPMFLALKGRSHEARHVVERMGRLNQASSVLVDFELNSEASGRHNGSLVSEMGRQMNMVFSAHFLVVTLVIMSVCFTLNLVYFGSLFAFPQVLPMLMHGQAASELLVGALWELPGLAMGLLLGIMASRPLTCSIICFIVGAHGHPEQEKTMKVFLFIGYYGIKCVPNIGFIVAYQMSAEVYPTEARSMGAGLALAAGRLAAMISPLIYEAAVMWTGTYLVFFLIMAALCISNLYMVDLLPEISGPQADMEVAPINPERIQVV
eukprot:symbB.v1.2.007193.t1/scaffold436.1/size343649/25